MRLCSKRQVHSTKCLHKRNWRDLILVTSQRSTPERRNKKEEIIPKKSREQEIIKLRGKINKIETYKQQQNIKSQWNKMIILLKASHRFGVIPINVLPRFFTGLERTSFSSI